MSVGNRDRLQGRLFKIWRVNKNGKAVTRGAVGAVGGNGGESSEGSEGRNRGNNPIRSN